MSTTRREFLSVSLGGAALASLGAGVPSFWGRLALAGAPQHADRDTILIVVQLAGGNDGLNTVVPYADDHYARNRRTLRLTEREVHKIDAHLGFHPRMEAFKRLYDEGHLAVVQGVAYPNQNESHPEAMAAWQTAMPGEANCQTGWIGRVVDEVGDPSAANVPAAYVGKIARPVAVNAQRAFVPSIRSLQQCTLKTMPGSAGGPVDRRRVVRAAETARKESENPLLGFVSQRAVEAYAAAEKIDEVARSAAPASSPFQLAQTFRVVAQLIRADVGIRIFYTELGGSQPGGFDNHANQRGNHGALLGELSESVAALVDDLKRDRLLERVVLMTFSEFGRTLAENGRRGTGHGEAAPMFLVGGRLKGGLVGPHPDLGDLKKGSPKFHTDFRRVYATVLESWLGFDSRPALGARFEPLDVLQV